MEIHKTISKCNMSSIQENCFKVSKPNNFVNTETVNLEVGFLMENFLDNKTKILDNDYSEVKKDIYNDKFDVDGINNDYLDLEHDDFIPQHDIVKVEENIISDHSPSRDVPYFSEQKIKKKAGVHQIKSKSIKGYPVRKCKFCKQTFKAYYQLQQHKATHTNKVPFACEICNKSFFTKSSFEKHIDCEKKCRAKQIKSTKKKFKCKLCNEKFISPYKLKEHNVTYHNKVPFSCEICNKTFYSKFNFDRHNECEYHIKKVHEQSLLFTN